MKKLTGATFIDLLFALSILSILVGIALPSFDRLLQNTSATQDIRLILSVLNFARNEAVSLKGDVLICPSSTDGNTCGTDWTTPWFVFEDANGNKKRDANESILRKLSVTKAGSSVRFFANTSNHYIRFDQIGSTGSQNGRIYYCSNDAEIKRQLILFRTGRARIAPTHQLRDRC